MKRVSKLKMFLMILRNFGMFFLMFCFVVTCCMLLFLNTFTAATGIEFTREYIEFAAKVTAVNIVFLSVVCTVIDALRHYFTVYRPVNRIANAAEKVMQGDFSVRVEKVKFVDSDDGYNVVIDYFNKMTGELSGIETLKTDFIADVSHEMKTPLAVIQNYGTMLGQTNLSEEKRADYAKTVTEAARNLADMVTNILKLNKLENQNIYPNKKIYNLGEQLCECLLGFEEAWGEKSLDIQTDIEEDVEINADPELLSLVWNNLFSNAVKFNKFGGTIFLTLKTENGTAVVTVADTGCGITPEAGKHIFEKFYQGDTSHAVKGNGLGLALVKRVIDATGGDISVQSKPGCGSTFTVSLNLNTE